MHIERGDEEEAIRHLKQAIVHNVNDPEVYYQLGCLYHKLGKAREARLSFERFLELAPDHPQADRVRQLLL